MTTIDSPVKLADYRVALTQPLRPATLCFLVRDGQVLLAMKKRGFGAGKWNGAGGKVEAGETIEAATVREAEEEIGVTPREMQRVATLNFYFPAHLAAKGWNQQVAVFLATTWDGEPAESEEMAPRWFSIDQLPHEAMWADDPYWLPQILEGARLEAHVLYADEERIEAWEVRIT